MCIIHFHVFRVKVYRNFLLHKKLITRTHFCRFKNCSNLPISPPALYFLATLEPKLRVSSAAAMRTYVSIFSAFDLCHRSISGSGSSSIAKWMPHYLEQGNNRRSRFGGLGSIHKEQFKFRACIPRRRSSEKREWSRLSEELGGRKGGSSRENTLIRHF